MTEVFAGHRFTSTSQSSGKSHRRKTCASEELFHLKVGNNIKGFEKIPEHTGAAYHFLYICAMKAIKTNAACKTLYKRWRSNGKTGNQALIAVYNKLLNHVFAVVKNNTLYQPNY